MEARHDRARRRARVRANRAGCAARCSSAGGRPLRFRGRARLASRRGGESGRLGRRGTAASFEPAAAGRVLARQTAHHSLLNDSALLASLPFALRAASMMDEHPQAANNAPSLPTAAMKGPKSDNSGASLAAGAKAATVGRLVGERAFHFGAATFTGAIASRTLGVNAPFAPGGASAANLAARTNLNGESACADVRRGRSVQPTTPPAPAPIAPRAGASPTNRVSATRAAAHEGARSGRKPDISAPPPVARAPSSASPPAPTGPIAKATDDRLPDPVTSAAPTAAQTDLFGAQLSAPFAAGASFQLDGSTASAGHADVTPRASALTAGAARLRSADQGDRRRSFAGRPRGCLDDDAARRRQAFCRHPRREFSDVGLDRRSARRDC